MRRRAEPSHRVGPRAFSLVEIVITVAILAFAMVPLMTSSQQSVRQTGYNIYRVTGANLCVSILDRYRNTPYQDLVALFGQGEEAARQAIAADPILNSKGMDPAHLDFVRRFDRSAMIEEIPGDPNLARFTAIVRWRSHPQRPPTVMRLSRIVVDYDKIGIKPISASGNYSFTRCDSSASNDGETGAVDARAIKQFWRDFGG